MRICRPRCFPPTAHIHWAGAGLPLLLSEGTRPCWVSFTPPGLNAQTSNAIHPENAAFFGRPAITPGGSGLLAAALFLRPGVNAMTHFHTGSLAFIGQASLMMVCFCSWTTRLSSSQSKGASSCRNSPNLPGCPAGIPHSISRKIHRPGHRLLQRMCRRNGGPPSGDPGYLEELALRRIGHHQVMSESGNLP